MAVYEKRQDLLVLDDGTVDGFDWASFATCAGSVVVDACGDHDMDPEEVDVLIEWLQQAKARIHAKQA